MGFVESGVVITTSKRHFRRKGKVDKRTLARVIALLKIPRAQRDRLSDAQSVHIFVRGGSSSSSSGGSGRGGGRSRSRRRRR